MKKLTIIAAVLLAAGAVHASLAPSGTVTRFVETDVNNVLIGPATNLLSANGISSSQDVALVASHLAMVSNQTVSAISSAAVAQASANAGIASGQVAQASAEAAMSTAITAQVMATSWVAASGTVVKASDYAPNVGVGITTNLSDTNFLLVAGAGMAEMDGGYRWSTNGGILSEPGYWNTNATYQYNGIKFSSAVWQMWSFNLDIGQAYAGSSTPTGTWTLVNGTNPPPVVTYGPALVTNTAHQGFLMIFSHISAPASPQHVGAAWHTNQIPAIDGTTNTIIYLGAP